MTIFLCILALLALDSSSYAEIKSPRFAAVCHVALVLGLATLALGAYLV